jgi:aspartate ammonia-lyase
MTAVRVEHDALGSVEIPAEALYGIQTARAVANLSVSRQRLGAYPADVATLALVKRAAARANYEAGVLDARLADAMHAAGLAAGDQLPLLRG